MEDRQQATKKKNSMISQPEKKNSKITSRGIGIDNCKKTTSKQKRNVAVTVRPNLGS
jgi:hypothetical protein